ncbi:MAG TPA: carbamoyltransferase HypF [Granulicella sp.]|nr:carbamoyltransferase HypF [Granulicella sp.]
MATWPIAAAVRKHIRVRGVVQGVGFRPFVYTLARSLGLVGHVFNSSSGVTIEVEGEESAVALFVRRLRDKAPPLARVAEVVVTAMVACGGVEFSIRESQEEAGRFGLVPADAGTCAACWSEFGVPGNRRYGYPFTNCTHCGPRYTIIHDVPYDRATTTMARFTMCAACEREYRDPEDRRFHAQPNACGVCGPSLALVARGASAAEVSFADQDALGAIRRARALLREGKILAVKGLGGFLLACDATNDPAVAELRRRKRRPDKPFALMARDASAVRRFCALSDEEEAVLVDSRRPIAILAALSQAAVRIADRVAPGNRTLGVMLPYTPLHYLLFGDSREKEAEFAALVMTSGNLSEEPILVTNEDALQRLEGAADWFLLHNRDIATRVDDSVVRVFEGRERVLRRSRGFVPQTVDLGMEMQEVLAFGAELKSTFCLTKGQYAILSQHIGDLENYETTEFFEETLEKMQRLFKLRPQAVAYDLHPDYRSTRLALASGIEKKIGVQHHHAHIASCMAENHLRGDVIGVAMDGTGYGTDGAIWGGEFLVASFARFERRGHLRYVPLPGGNAAVRQPWRMALSYLRDAFGMEIPEELARFRGVGERQMALVDAMIARRVQTVPTSSCGRLFDAVAAMLGVASEVSFEGQAAIALEMAIELGVEERYEFELADGAAMVVDLRPMMRGVARDVASGKSVGAVAARFHNTVSAAIVEVCCRIRRSDGLDRVCLSGGSFQNVYLMGRTAAELRRLGFGVFLHAMVPANDGGIALGQAVIANEWLHRGG